jgi:hypothetical protein
MRVTYLFAFSGRDSQLVHLEISSDHPSSVSYSQAMFFKSSRCEGK